MVKEDYIPDCIFPSDNQADIPNLLLDMAPEFCQVPFYCFGEQKRTFDMKGAGTLHFYTDDYKFNALFERPETIIKQNPACMVEPNYSLYFDTPLAFGLQKGDSFSTRILHTLRNKNSGPSWAVCRMITSRLGHFSRVA